MFAHQGCFWSRFSASHNLHVSLPWLEWLLKGGEAHFGVMRSIQSLRLRSYFSATLIKRILQIKSMRFLHRFSPLLLWPQKTVGSSGQGVLQTKIQGVPSWPEANLLPGQVSNILSPARVRESETQPFLLVAFPFSSVRAEGRWEVGRGCHPFSDKRCAVQNLARQCWQHIKWYGQVEAAQSSEDFPPHSEFNCS